MFNYLTFVTIICAVSASKWDQSSLRILTNEVDSDVLNYYSDIPNKITDVVLTGIRDYLVNNNETRIGIPNIDVNFTESILGLDIISGEFKAYNGVFYNTATIVRRGNSSVQTSGLHCNLSTVIGFTDMEVYFPRYVATVIGIQEEGEVKVVIGTNQIALDVTATLLPKCTVSLTQLKLEKFADITTDITGLGILNGLADDITAWVLSSYETSFSSLIENIVSNKLSEVLRKPAGSANITADYCKR
uniref:Mite allergen Lep d 7 n=1 Tax=Lygus hesperus TaxID=30085 RepID=A0A0A9Y3B8_LYGHE